VPPLVGARERLTVAADEVRDRDLRRVLLLEHVGAVAVEALVRVDRDLVEVVGRMRNQWWLAIEGPHDLLLQSRLLPELRVYDGSLVGCGGVAAPQAGHRTGRSGRSRGGRRTGREPHASGQHCRDRGHRDPVHRSSSWRNPKRNTFFEHTSMHRPQLVHSGDRMTGPRPRSAPFNAGLITCSSGHTA
jgi:hypothetical protein